MDSLLSRIGVREEDRPWVEFALKIVLLYGLWKVFQLTVNNTPVLLAWWKGWTDVYSHKVATLGNKFFEALGYEVTYHYYKAIYLLSTPGIMIEEHCLAIPATLIFGFFIAVFQGPWKHKLWFIPLGMIGVQAINFIRLVGLTFLMKHAPARYFDFNHSVTALIFEYGLVFLMIVYWMRKYYHYNDHSDSGHASPSLRTEKSVS